MPAPRKRDTQSDVLSQLPSKRPQRASARRARSATKSPAVPAASAGPKRPAATGKAAPKASTARATKAAAKRSDSTARAKPAGSPTPRAVRPSAATNRTREPGPRAGSARRPGARPAPPPTRPGVDMIETAVQAAGELAQIGVTFGIQALRGAISRLPKP
jgi:hypothetical protein